MSDAIIFISTFGLQKIKVFYFEKSVQIPGMKQKRGRSPFYQNAKIRE